MNGIIVHKNKHILWMWLLIICGMFLSGLFIHIMLTEAGLNVDDFFMSCFFITFGVFILIIGIIGLINEYRAFIIASENGIEAFSTNFFVGRRISCRYSEIMSVRLGMEGTLCIRLYDQVNDFEITNLQNCKELVDYIKNHIRYRKPKADAETLKGTVLCYQTSRKAATKKLLYLFACLIFLLVAAIVFTGAKEIHDFNLRELIVFILIAVLFVFTLIAICTILPHVLKLNDALDHTAEQLVQILLRNTAPGPGNVVAMFLNDKDRAAYRCVVYRYHQSESVFYTIEIVNSEFDIEVVEESTVYTNFESLPAEIRTMTEIPVSKAK